jgi:hypothetical protein
MLVNSESEDVKEAYYVTAQMSTTYNIVAKNTEVPKGSLTGFYDLLVEQVVNRAYDTRENNSL